jgi:hypothetical protein
MPLWHNRTPDPEKMPETPKNAREARKTGRAETRQTRVKATERDMQRKPKDER